ncbi:MAG TPA: acyltransferase [Deltaproteobacteria bacterium]|nr:acyltransferase [Deltaproteobacteria bacterium]
MSANSLIEIFKYLYWDMASPLSRDQYIAALLRNIPGDFGIVLRRKWYTGRFSKAGKGLSIHPGTVVLNPGCIECGDCVNIGLFNYIQGGGGIIMGSNVLLGPYTRIWTQNHNYKNPDIPVRAQGYTFRPVIMGDDVWIGANVFVMPGVVLGSRCVVSANSVVGRKEYPPGMILAGYPARKIGAR